jgi:hypothetical protein
MAQLDADKLVRVKLTAVLSGVRELRAHSCMPLHGFRPCQEQGDFANVSLWRAFEECGQ